jgi:uncharacterized protein (TIGR03083 family)
VNRTLEFPDLLRLIEERSVAFRAAVMSAPGLELQVPTCPKWTLLDLVQHLGEVHRFWAAAVNAGPAAAAPVVPASVSEGAEAAARQREALLAWSAESTRLLLDALRAVGPDRGCWTWWGESQSPQTSGAVARHQVQEATVHTYDAQITVGVAQPLPEEVALDGVDEFLTTCCEGTDPWPHGTAVIDFHAAEGCSWRISLSADGARTTRLPTPGPIITTAATVSSGVAFASVRGAAAAVVLALYGRVPIDSLYLDGDRRQLELFRDWD